MDRKSNHSAPVLTDPALMNKSRLGIHSSSYSPPGVVFSPGLFITMQRKKSIKLDDVRASSWLDSMKSSSPTHRKIAKDSGTELLSADADAVYHNWMVILPLSWLTFSFFCTVEIFYYLIDLQFWLCSSSIHLRFQLLST